MKVSANQDSILFQPVRIVDPSPNLLDHEPMSDALAVHGICGHGLSI